ncbi:hypothetical protein DFJ77DRAFT_538274 [Powellomyces hirtus]|nr:hypothetical protein DFJ77DRAFT_538274 [Powellomyces hirtus]
MEDTSTEARYSPDDRDDVQDRYNADDEDEHESRPSVVLRKAADKLATMLSMRKSGSRSTDILLDDGIVQDKPDEIVLRDNGEEYASDEMDALLDRREDSSGEDSDWAKEVADEEGNNSKGRWRKDRPHPHMFRDHHDELPHSKQRPQTSSHRVEDGQTQSRISVWAPDDSVPQPPATDDSPPARSGRRAQTADTARSAPTRAKREYWCRYYKGMPDPPFLGVDLKKYPAVDVARPWIIEGRKQEMRRANRALMLRMTNPWSEVDNTTMLMSYFQAPPYPIKLDQRKPTHPLARPAGPKPHPLVKPRPQTAPARQSAGSAYYDRLSKPRTIPKPSPFPADFTPHPRRTSRSAKPMSAERIEALATRHKTVVVEEVIPSLHGGPKKLDPSIWDRLSVPRTRVVWKTPASAKNSKSKLPKQSIPEAAVPAPRRRLKSVEAPPKTSVLTGKYGTVKPPSTTRSSGLHTVEDSDDESAQGEPYVESEAAVKSIIDTPPRKASRCESIVEEEDLEPQPATGSRQSSARLRNSRRTSDGRSGGEAFFARVSESLSKNEIQTKPGSAKAEKEGLGRAEEPSNQSIRLSHSAFDSESKLNRHDANLRNDEAPDVGQQQAVQAAVYASVAENAPLRGSGRGRNEVLDEVAGLPLPPSAPLSLDNFQDIAIGYRKVDGSQSDARSRERGAERSDDGGVNYAASKPLPPSAPGSRLQSTEPMNTSAETPSLNLVITNSARRAKSQQSLKEPRDQRPLSPAKSSSSVVARSPRIVSPSKNKSMLLPSRENIPYLPNKRRQRDLHEPPLPKVAIRIGS